MKIDGFLVDVCKTESISAESEVTEHPVENGVAIADHVVVKPLEYECDVVVSDTPIGAVADDPSRQAGEGAPLPSRDMFNRMVELRTSKRTITIETVKFGTLQNMELTKFEPKAQADTGNSLQFTATFRQINVITNQRVTVRVATPASGSEVDLGNLQTGRFTGRFLPWIKGTPPGGKPNGQVEILAVRDKQNSPRNNDLSIDPQLRHMLTHGVGLNELTPAEYAAFNADWERDRSANIRKRIANVETEFARQGDKLDRLEKFAAAKDAAAKDPTKGPVTREMFGL